MKIDNRKYIELRKEDKKHIIEKVSSHGNFFFKHVKTHVNNWEKRIFLFTQSVVDTVVDIPDNVPNEILWKAKHRSGTFLLPNKTAFHYFFNGDTISVMNLTSYDLINGETGLNYINFSMLKVGEYLEQEKEMNDKIKIVRSQFIKLLVFLEFSDVETVFVKKGKSQKRGLKNLKNKLEHDITIVNHAWNKVYNIPSTTVRGHWRLQPYGVGRKETKLIFIKSHLRSGYKKGRK